MSDTEQMEMLGNRILASMNPQCDFEALALEIFDFQRRNNPVLEKYADGITPTDWKEIPALPQIAFKTEGIRCFPANQTVQTFQTSGTTGATPGLHHFRSLELYEASILQGWQQMQLPNLSRIVLIPEAHQVPHSSLSYMMSTLRKLPGHRRQIEGFTLEGGLLLDKICHFLGKHEADGEPVLILGTALAFLHLFERLRETGRRYHLPPGSYGWETGGYKGSGRELSKEELYAEFENWLGLPSDHIINEYGMTELSSQFYATGLKAPHRGPAWVRGLVVHPETGKPCAEGETGFLRIYDLANLGSSIGIETQDLAIARDDGFELLGRDAAALPRGCSRAADEWIRRHEPA